MHLLPTTVLNDETGFSYYSGGFCVRGDVHGVNCMRERAETERNRAKIEQSGLFDKDQVMRIDKIIPRDGFDHWHTVHVVYGGRTFRVLVRYATVLFNGEDMDNLSPRELEDMSHLVEEALIARGLLWRCGEDGLVSPDGVPCFSCFLAERT